MSALELELPKSSVHRIIKNALGETKIALDAKTAITKASSVFLMYLTEAYVESTCERRAPRCCTLVR